MSEWAKALRRTSRHRVSQNEELTRVYTRATIMAGGSPIGSRTGGGPTIPLTLLLLRLTTARPIELLIDNDSGPNIRLK